MTGGVPRLVPARPRFAHDFCTLPDTLADDGDMPTAFPRLADYAKLPRVLIDGEPAATRVASLTDAADLARAAGRLVVAVSVDGRAVDSERELAALYDALPHAAREVRVETAALPQLLADVAGALHRSIDEADRARLAAAEQFQAGHEADARRSVGQFAGVFDDAQQGMRQLAGLLGVELATVPDAEPLAADYAAKLGQLKLALVEHDTVGAADVLAYELDDLHDRWRDVVNLLADAA